MLSRFGLLNLPKVGISVQIWVCSLFVLSLQEIENTKIDEVTISYRIYYPGLW